MASESDRPSPDTQSGGTHDPIFEPPEEAIAKILPFLVDERELRILGHSVFANNLFYDLGDGRIVKTGVDASDDEAKAMMFVREHTTIPVPEVHMVFQYNGATHIVMERIDGVALREAVDHDETGSSNPNGALVTAGQVVSIMQQLKGFIAELRELGRRFPQEEPQLRVVARGSFPQLDGHILAIVDWETFGWYPDFWEYMGVGNEATPPATFQAIKTVFGDTPFVCETYRYVHSCLTYPFYYQNPWSKVVTSEM
ncbi:hypothetical protein C8T65DRAFT_740346 [Cerioporus squamosus]|nr:hypothetical protein C8T65DRAFT_740346 [Cerioporus squamosus]